MNQDRIYQEYSATYSSTGNGSTTAYAQFRFGDGTGTTLEMVDNCSVSHDTISLSKDFLSGIVGTSYSGSKDGSRVKSHTFTFSDNDNNSYVNTADLPEKTEFANTDPQTISKSSPQPISFTGGGLKADESIFLHITIESGDTSHLTTISEFDETATSIDITSSDVSNLVTGIGTMYLSRKKSTNLQQAASVGGRFYTYHRSTAIEVTVTD